MSQIAAPRASSSVPALPRLRYSGIAQFFASFAAAKAVAAAIEDKRTPDAEALRELGIDSAAFEGVRLV